ncbi:hypothetical protein LguiB_003084 [Lonicera macranthoides]
MKITSNTYLPDTTTKSSKPLNPSPHSDPFHKLLSRHPPHRKTHRNPTFSGAKGVSFKRDGAPPGKRSRPETPLLRWKVDDGKEKRTFSAKDEKPVPEFGRRIGRKPKGGIGEVVVSARKLAAGLWRLQPPEVSNNGGDRLGVQTRGGHARVPVLAHQKDLIHSPPSVSGPRNGFFCKLEPSFHFSNSAMEGATKWDPTYWRTLEEVKRIYGQSKHIDEQVGVVSAVAVLEVELEQAQTRINQLETERHSSKKKLEHFLKKLSEERAMWRSREHEKIRAIVDDLKSDLNRERKTRQRMEMVNSKLVNELADVKLSARRFMQEYEKERKARELTEIVCDELAKEIGNDKAEVEELKRESMKLQEEVEDERKILQMAEVWREERVQMKLVDVKVAVEEKYSQMSKLVAGMETFLRSKFATLDLEEVRKAEILRESAASVNIRDIRDFSYEPANPDDIFSDLEDVNFGELKEREIDPYVSTVSPEVNAFDKNSVNRYSNAYFDQNDEIEDDESGWETVSHPEDHGSSYSPDGSDPSVNKVRRDSNTSGSATDWEENEAVREISEVCSVPNRPLKKVPSKSRAWRSFPSSGENYKIVSVEGENGQLTNGGVMMSLEPGSQDQWRSSPESENGNGNPHITRGMKGCIEWPRGGVQQKNSLKAKLMEARMETQKIQLRHS